ncbi:extracellular solute-binding protein [Thermosipho sp. (in: thermotogales)]|jgi:multiple sugar transport system substrate-binding protein|uniref:extracellular solute-binding protein n=1 Tax=Thermosipho sp. (in: thermotogales) TaxID=1968895 RepID=UPI00257EC6B0|nr:extracellular solute-binding protein [Thermosipho sp. (in: thermotogales)]MBZ4649399.1 extracellular solute-binding protein family 1 [Thermosipho sp. (in: thermotogales)]MDK2839481.1 multiple sugar transport system substrate-binding protein [Thermosipho sp. (in: thermotogales)]
MKKILIMLVLVLSLTLLAGKIQLTFMTPLSGADGSYMDQIIQKFNESHPNVEIIHLVVGSSLEYKQKLATGISTKSAPEILLIRKHDMPLFLDYFKQFSKEDLSKYGIDINDIYPSVLSGLTTEDGKYYGIPLDVWIFYMAYRKDNFVAAGLDPDLPLKEGPLTQEQFVNVLRELRKVTPEGAFPWTESPSWDWEFVHLLWQFGGDILTPDFKHPAFKEAGIKVLHFLQQLQEEGLYPDQPVDAGPSFESGVGSILITGIWTINPWLSLLGDDFGYAPAPQLGTKKSVFGGSHVIAIPEVMVSDPEVYNAAMTWVKYLWDHAIEWYAAGQTPARISIAQSQEFKEKFPHLYVAAQQVPYVKTFQMFPYIAEILSEIVPYIEEVLINKTMTPEEAMEEAEQVAQEIIDDYWDTVGE